MSINTSKTEVIGEVLTYNPATNTNDFLGYTEKSVHKKHGDMYKVVTKRGHYIVATDDHSLATTGDDSFFSPLPPQDSLHRFVPIMSSMEYSVDESIELKAFSKLLTAIKNKDVYFDSYMLEVPKEACLGVILDLFKFDGEHTLTYSCKDETELETAKVVLGRVGIPGVEFRGNDIIINTDSDRLVPDDGTLKKAELVEKENPGNPYLKLPYDWDEVVSVEKVLRERTTYDFSVPEFPLFMANGILVYDTMQLHVPATEEARTEALEKMLPSKNLFSPRTGDPLMLPQQEHIYGLYLASRDVKDFKSGTKFKAVTDVDKTFQDIRMGLLKPNTPVTYKGYKTTAGLVVLNDLLPITLRKYNVVWTKPVVAQTLSQIGKTKSEDYTRVADGIKELGSLFAYKLGASYHMSDFDLKDLKKKRNAYFSKIDKELAAIDAKKGLTTAQAEAEKGKLLRKAQDFAQKLTDEATDNSFQQWAYTGSKGSKSQVMQIITSPTVVADPKDRLIPALIHTSYNEGLSPADYWVSSYGTRKGTVGAKLSVAPAGALSKELVGNTLDLVISKKDCGTQRGLTYPIDDAKNVINRVEAKTNKFIDANYYELLKRRGVKEVVVRSPATCEARDGLCQFCYGYNEKLKFPDIGENVGVVATQAITEPMTQMGLSSKHTAGTAAGEAVGFNTIKSFFNMSTKFNGAAVISEVTGQVSRIEKSPTGGTNVYVGRKKYYVPPTRTLKVKMGDHINAGEPLTDGILNISKVVPYKGIDQGRKQFVNSASDLYSRAGQSSLKKNFEVISRGLINYVQITDPGDFDEYVEGDVVDYNQLMADIRMSPAKKKPSFTPIQKGTNKAPTYKKDWLANFGFKYLKGELIENAATNAKSPLHSYHPIGSYARGIEFGRGKDGRY